MDLNLRNVDEEMVRRLKAEAAKDGKTLRDYCVEKLNGQRFISVAVDPKTAVFVGKNEILPVGAKVVAPQPRVTDVTSSIQATVEEGEPCTYREYDGETGETYGCSLPLGHRVKHRRGAKL